MTAGWSARIGRTRTDRRSVDNAAERTEFAEASDHADAGADEGGGVRRAGIRVADPPVPLPPGRPGTPAALPVDPPPRSAVRAKTCAAQADIQRNRVTAGRLQLRLGRDLRWYPYARSDGGWEPSGAPEADPARALTDL